MICKWCGDEVFRKQGRIWLCKKHYRFQQMRVRAKSRGKAVPSYDWLEEQWRSIKGSCPVCHRDVNWLSKEGSATVLTLQHDRNGDMRLLCLSCNVRHASFEDDSFYETDPNRRICPRCRRSLPWGAFCADNNSRWKNKKSYCRQCSTKYHNEWVIKNRKRENAKRRKYYHARIESGNPIPR